MTRRIEAAGGDTWSIVGSISFAPGRRRCRFIFRAAARAASSISIGQCHGALTSLVLENIE